MESNKEVIINDVNDNNVKLSAEEYIKKHELDKVFPEMINSLLYEKAQKPKNYMVRFCKLN